MYCRNCGQQIDDRAVICPYCGVPQQNIPVYTPPVEQDAPSGGFAVLCFFFPVVGLILYLVWKDQYPLKAKSCGKGALISVIVYGGFVAFTLFFTLIIASIAVSVGAGTGMSMGLGLGLLPALL